MNNSNLAALCTRTWSLPVLSLLAGTAGARVSPTAHALGAGRKVTSDTFVHLCAIGLVERMPGHGHPLRPEYRLSRAGEPVAEWARVFWTGLSEVERDVVRRAWALPVLRLLSNAHGFGELRAELQPITDRALALCLQRLTKNELVRRDVDASRRPPRVTYVADGRGATLAATLRSTYDLEA